MSMQTVDIEAWEAKVVDAEGKVQYWHVDTDELVSTRHLTEYIQHTFGPDWRTNGELWNGKYTISQMLITMQREFSVSDIIAAGGLENLPGVVKRFGVR